MPTSYPAAFDALTNPATTDPLTAPSHAGQHADANDAIEALQVRAGRTGSSFPGTPATGDRFLRTDRDIEYFYDGTRWLSAQLYSTPLGPGDAVLPISTTGQTPLRLATMGSLYDWYLVDLFTTLRTTTLDTSNYWTAAFRKFQVSTTVTTIASVSMQNDTQGNWTSVRTAINALLNNGTTHTQLDLNFTKTGAPGALYAMALLTYRLVG